MELAHVKWLGGVNMQKFLVIYTSTTGNTEIMADVIGRYLINTGKEVEIKTFDVDPVYANDLYNYDAVLIGTPTWFNGELPYEVEDFLDDLEDCNISGKIFGVFGSADSLYDTYGQAIDTLADQLVVLGGDVLTERLKVDLTPNDSDLMTCEQWADQLLQKFDGYEANVS